MIDVLERRALRDRVPFLGVCLGMELLAERSEEGTARGLGWVSGEVVRFRLDDIRPRLPVPHMGWNDVQVVRDCPLFRSRLDEQRFYFAHSYHFVPEDGAVAVGLTAYGHDFVSVLASGNIFGVQFHPEKSHRYGLELLRRFVTA
jgi:glutamine amidotransferase